MSTQNPAYVAPKRMRVRRLSKTWRVTCPCCRGVLDAPWSRYSKTFAGALYYVGHHLADHQRGAVSTW